MEKKIQNLKYQFKRKYNKITKLKNLNHPLKSAINLVKTHYCFCHKGRSPEDVEILIVMKEKKKDGH